MKQPLLLLLSIAMSVNLFAQKKPKESFYLFDKNWKPVSKQEEAAFFARTVQTSDTSVAWDEYNYMGPKLKSLTYLNDKLDTLNGYQTIYRSTGYIDSAGPVYRGKMHGDWVYLNDTGKVIFTKTYEQGLLISVKDHLKPDSAYVKESYDDEKESEFPGGLQKWRYYLTKNMHYPDRALNGSVMGNVIVLFVVNSTGQIENPEILKSVEYSLDEEALRLIKISPTWTPAFQNGRNVKSYKKQPIGFRFQ